MNILDKKNSEGYSDPTPYQAARNMIKPGEIWTFNKKDNTEAEVLIVAFNDNIATILYLMDEYKEGCVQIGYFGEYYVNPRMLNWSWGGFLGRCVRKLDLQAFTEIIVEIEKILAVHIEREAVVTVNHSEIDNLNAERDSLLCRYKESDSMAKNYAAQKYKIQLDTIKEMYSDLMEKYLQKG